MIWFILLLVILFLVLPAIFLLIGVFRRGERNGVFFFMLGIFWIAIPLSELFLIFLRWLFGAPIDSDNGEILFVPIFGALMYGGFHLYTAVLQYPYNTLIRNVKRIVAQMSDANLPSCTSVVASDVLRNASRIHDYHNPELTARYAALISCMNLIASHKYHSSVSGALLGVGEQLMYVSQESLEYLSRNGMINDQYLSEFREELNRISFHDDRTWIL